MKNLRTLSKKYGSKIAAAPVALFAFASAHAADGDGITSALDSIDLSGITVKVIAAGLVVVAIALAFKGPQIAKRVVRGV